MDAQKPGGFKRCDTLVHLGISAKQSQQTIPVSRRKTKSRKETTPSLSISSTLSVFARPSSPQTPDNLTHSQNHSTKKPGRTHYEFPSDTSSHILQTPNIYPWAAFPAPSASPPSSAPT